MASPQLKAQFEASKVNIVCSMPAWQLKAQFMASKLKIVLCGGIRMDSLKMKHQNLVASTSYQKGE
jgi:hypothetical protein